LRRAIDPIAEGAQKIDFHADEAYEVTPLHRGFCRCHRKIIYQIAASINGRLVSAQDIKGKAFPAFGLAEGQIFSESSPIYTQQRYDVLGSEEYRRNADSIRKKTDQPIYRYRW
jgi:hypothetical protein